MLFHALLRTFPTGSDCNIVTNLIKRWLILFVTVIFLDSVLARTSRRRDVWVSPGESGTDCEYLRYL